jgi:hypothetical protein
VGAVLELALVELHQRAHAMAMNKKGDQGTLGERRGGGGGGDEARRKTSA